MSLRHRSDNPCLQEVDQQAIEEALGIELGKDEEEEEEEEEEHEGETQQSRQLPHIKAKLIFIVLKHHTGCFDADERSEQEEPATTSADDEASKKNATEQQKQLSKKVCISCFTQTNIAVLYPTNFIKKRIAES